MVIRIFDHNSVVKSANILPIDDHSFRRFIVERPTLNLSVLSDDLSIDCVNLHKIISGLRKIPKAKRGMFLQVAQKYDFTVEVAK